MGDKLLDQIFNLKFTSKQLVKQSHKSEKEEKSEKLKVKKAIEKGNIDGAKIYAQNAIRKKNEALNYLRLASRLDAVVSRLDTQAKMQMINKSMVGIVKALDKALQSNNLDRVAATMEQFEKQFENLDVQTGCVEDAMNQQATLSTPEEDVNLLLQQVRSQINFSLLQYGVSDPVPGCNSTLAFSEMLRKHHTFDPQPRTWSDIIRSLFVGQVADEHGLEQQLGLPQAGTQVAAPQAAQAAPESDLTARLAQLRNK